MSELSFKTGKRQRRRGLPGLDCDVAPDFAHDRQVQQPFDQKSLVPLKIGDDDFEQIVGFAGHHVTGKDFRHRAHRILKCQSAVVRMRLYLDCQKYRKAESDTVTAEYGAIALDDAIALQALHTTKAGGRR